MVTSFPSAGTARLRVLDGQVIIFSDHPLKRKVEQASGPANTPHASHRWPSRTHRYCERSGDLDGTMCSARKWRKMGDVGGLKLEDQLGFQGRGELLRVWTLNKYKSACATAARVSKQTKEYSIHQRTRCWRHSQSPLHLSHPPCFIDPEFLMDSHSEGSQMACISLYVATSRNLKDD